MYANSDWKYIPYIYKYDPVFSEGTVNTFDLSSRLLYSVTKSVSIYAGGGLVINTVFSVDSSIFPYLGSGVRLNVLRSFFFDISGGVYFNGMELNLNSEGTAGTSFDTGSPYMIGLAVGIKIK